jgi:hypothetical protein
MKANIAQYNNVVQLENYIKDNMDTVELEVSHHQIPGDFVLTSKIHKHECINVMTKGVLVISEGNGDYKKLVSGDIFISSAGTKRAGYAIEDVVYVTAHHTFETDIDIIEDYLACDSVDDYMKYLEKLS